MKILNHITTYAVSNYVTNLLKTSLKIFPPQNAFCELLPV